MSGFELSKDDEKQIKALGLSKKIVARQLEIFVKGISYIRLDRPATINDGVKSITQGEAIKLVDFYNQTAPGKNIIKFVPASGAASRMFKALISFYNKRTKGSNDLNVSGDNSESEYLLKFFDSIREFAFYEDLKLIMANDGFDLDEFEKNKRFKEITGYILAKNGLNYAFMPKGLIKFHKYSDKSRTAFEEHLVEAVGYVKDIHQKSSLHFTVSIEHKEKFENFFKKVRPEYENALGVKFDVSFSVQKRSTDTMAVDMNNKPFRLDNRAILFRPGGHGALIENLNNLNAEIIFIKNIDNVVHGRFKEEIIYWKRVMGGYLLKLQQEIFSFIKRLTRYPDDEILLQKAFDFAKAQLCISPKDDLKYAPITRRYDFLLNKLDRPVRVCGMVKNLGEPGGGPFWVKNSDNEISLQIVEKVQVNPSSSEQQGIIAASTHFNPVDIVCSVLDYKGKPYDLKRYVDDSAVFVSQKSQNGMSLKALELPGLWNGAMSDWNTVFIELPIITFNPVKTVNDLLRQEHRAAV